MRTLQNLGGSVNVIRKTKSVCPVCAAQIEAHVIEREGRVFLDKECKKHGKYSIKISKDARRYKQFMNFYENFRDIFIKKKANGYCIFVNTKCNLDCNICFIHTHNFKDYKEPTIKIIRDFCSTLDNAEISLSGGEPTLRKDLPQIIKTVLRTGNTPIVYSNGIKISKLEYLKELKDAGLQTIGLQFDGFDAAADQRFRGADLTEVRRKALGNIRKMGMRVILMVTVGKGVTDSNLKDILEYGVKNHFVKAIAFRGYTVMGCADEKKYTMTSEEIVDKLDEQTDGRFRFLRVLFFQKLLYIYSEFLGLKNCPNLLYYLVVRDNKGYNKINSKKDNMVCYHTVNEVFKLKRLRKIIDGYIKINYKNAKLNYMARWMHRYFVIIPSLITYRSIGLLFSLGKIVIMRMLSDKNVVLDDIDNLILPIMFEGSCDRFFL
ncbi:radical SAM protein [Candidatus Woesearchaeota archaeon]|nr:radical SAM protein [Candidatus Woesearchaeota archaeon]